MTDSCALYNAKLNDTENRPIQTEQSDTKQQVTRHFTNYRTTTDDVMVIRVSASNAKRRDIVNKHGTTTMSGSLYFQPHYATSRLRLHSRNQS